MRHHLRSSSVTLLPPPLRMNSRVTGGSGGIDDPSPSLLSAAPVLLLLGSKISKFASFLASAA